ncbi:hypothetical protein ACFVXH_12995 [Kitasatospora sp. NPDC058184]|uniref:hypothetical protein n=1 Tax=Kitasatospora sp. NPDC058184 TaxID=3346370 RepID=UPI0036DED09C
MSWTLGLEYLKAVIWPAFAFTLVIVFREQAAALLRRISSVDTPLGTATFDAQVDAVAQESEEIRDNAAAEAEVTAPVAAPPGAAPRRHQVPGLMPDSDYATLREAALSNPVAGVTRAWLAVERAVRDVVTVAGDPMQERLPSTDVQLAVRQGVMSPELGRAVEDLLVIRNRSVHEPDLPLSTESALSYVEAAKNVVAAIAYRRRERELEAARPRLPDSREASR